MKETYTDDCGEDRGLNYDRNSNDTFEKYYVEVKTKGHAYIYNIYIPFTSTICGDNQQWYSCAAQRTLAWEEGIERDIGYSYIVHKK